MAARSIEDWVLAEPCTQAITGLIVGLAILLAACAVLGVGAAILYRRAKTWANRYWAAVDYAAVMLSGSGMRASPGGTPTDPATAAIQESVTLRIAAHKAVVRRNGQWLALCLAYPHIAASQLQSRYFLRWIATCLHRRRREEGASRRRSRPSI
jgi:hypothetical protein